MHTNDEGDDEHVARAATHTDRGLVRPGNPSLAHRNGRGNGEDDLFDEALTLERADPLRQMSSAEMTSSPSAEMAKPRRKHGRSETAKASVQA